MTVQWIGRTTILAKIFRKKNNRDLLDSPHRQFYQALKDYSNCSTITKARYRREDLCSQWPSTKTTTIEECMIFIFEEIESKISRYQALELFSHICKSMSVFLLFMDSGAIPIISKYYYTWRGSSSRT